VSDLERELLELRNRVSESINPSPEMAGRVLRRSRIRRVVTAMTGLLVVGTLGLASLTAVQAFTAPAPQNPVAPLPPVKSPTPTQAPSPTESTSPEIGRDIGLAFPVCDVSRVGGIDLLGDGTAGSAWTATPVTDDGRCKKGIEDSYLVAVDVTGDGLADATWSLKYCFFCEPLGATDFDGDGDDELVVLTQGGSVPGYSVFSAPRAADGSVDIEPVSVADPGNPEGDLRAGKPLRIWAGGDEGFGAAVACEGYPEDPVLVVAWSNHPVEGPGSETTEVHVTRLVLRDGAFHVVDALNTEQPTEDPLPEVFSSSGEACGLEFGF
jgi:hypothetical protein